MTAAADITGLVLAGGRGSRMGGVDKGLQLFRGRPLAEHALLRLSPQVGAVALNANRHLAKYAAMGAPVWPDSVPDFAGPLAGFLAGMQHCRTRWMLTVPCDTPMFPWDLASRLAEAAAAADADLAVALAPEIADAAAPAALPAALRRQPVFCLMRTALHDDLQDYLQAGGRKIGAWLARHACAQAPFDLPADDPLAFTNANTLPELRALESAVKCPAS